MITKIVILKVPWSFLYQLLLPYKLVLFVCLFVFSFFAYCAQITQTRLFTIRSHFVAFLGAIMVVIDMIDTCLLCVRQKRLLHVSAMCPKCTRVNKTSDIDQWITYVMKLVDKLQRRYNYAINNELVCLFVCLFFQKCKI